MAKCDICGRGAFFGNQVWPSAISAAEALSLEIRSAIHIEDLIKSGTRTFRELL